MMTKETNYFFATHRAKKPFCKSENSRTLAEKIFDDQCGIRENIFVFRVSVK